MYDTALGWRLINAADGQQLYLDRGDGRDG